MKSENWTKKDVSCPLDMTFAIIGGKYKAKIVYYLLGQTLRYSELQRRIPAATPRMLSRQLQELEQDGIIHRELYPIIPPRTEYSLTERGLSLAPLIVKISEWGRLMFASYGMEVPCSTADRERMYRVAAEYENRDK